MSDLEVWSLAGGRSCRREKGTSQWVERDGVGPDGQGDRVIRFPSVLSGPDIRPVQAPSSSVLSYIEMLTFHNPQVTQACQERPQANTEKIIKDH